MLSKSERHQEKQCESKCRETSKANLRWNKKKTNANQIGIMMESKAKEWHEEKQGDSEWHYEMMQGKGPRAMASVKRKHEAEKRGGGTPKGLLNKATMQKLKNNTET